MTPLDRIVARINRGGNINEPGTPRPLVTLEEFFEGNTDYGSIGYNFYPDQPSPAEFYGVFNQVRARPEVAEVRVQVSHHDVPDEWPSSDTIWIITSASAEDVASWLGERFRADEIFVGWPEDWPVESNTIPPGMHALGVWWD